MTDLRKRLVALVSAVAILFAVVVLPGCKKQGAAPAPREPNKATAPAPAPAPTK
jgi:hypothetical protein